MQKRINVLFVCSKNKWRSRTAETIYKDDSRLNVKSAGTEKGAEVKINDKLVNWANAIFVMEKKHKEFLQKKFTSLNPKKISILEIADEYDYMNQELIEMLQTYTKDYFKY